MVAGRINHSVDQSDRTRRRVTHQGRKARNRLPAADKDGGNRRRVARIYCRDIDASIREDVVQDFIDTLFQSNDFRVMLKSLVHHYSRSLDSDPEHEIGSRVRRRIWSAATRGSLKIPSDFSKTRKIPQAYFPYIYRVMRNIVIDKARLDRVARDKSEPTISIHNKDGGTRDVEHGVSVLDDLIKEETITRLLATIIQRIKSGIELMKSKSDRYRSLIQAFVAAMTVPLPYPEIAKDLEISDSTFKSRLRLTKESCGLESLDQDDLRELGAVMSVREPEFLGYLEQLGAQRCPITSCGLDQDTAIASEDRLKAVGASWRRRLGARLKDSIRQVKEGSRVDYLRQIKALYLTMASAKSGEKIAAELGLSRRHFYEILNKVRTTLGLEDLNIKHLRKLGRVLKETEPEFLCSIGRLGAEYAVPA